MGSTLVGTTWKTRLSLTTRMPTTAMLLRTNSAEALWTSASLFGASPASNVALEVSFGLCVCARQACTLCVVALVVSGASHKMFRVGFAAGVPEFILLIKTHVGGRAMGSAFVAALVAALVEGKYEVG